MRAMPIKMRLTAVLLALLVVLGGAGTALAADFKLVGSGWGHGVGLSQYGAKAMATDGATYDEIVNRYFTGVSVAPFTTAASGSFVALDSTPFWVGLIQDAGTVSFALESDGARLCFDIGGSCVTTAQPGETYRFAPDGTGNCLFLQVLPTGDSRQVGHSGSCDASVRPLSDSTEIVIPFKARSYRHGTLRFRQVPDGVGIHTIYEIGVDDYLKGVSEVPESWPVAAAEAQVVVSRSYAVKVALDRGSASSISAARKQDCYCNLHDDRSDQVFRGWTGETAHPNWVGAVASTARQVIAANGTVALGLYSSSSGGWTESYVDVYGETGYPYLSSVRDSPAFSVSAANPHEAWAAGYDQSTLAEIFGLSWVSGLVVTEKNDSGSVRTASVFGIVDGRPAEITVTGVELREALSLRSTTFSIESTPRYGDVPADYAFAGEVVGLDTLGITRGCADGRFCPGDAVTRAEMAAFLIRAFDLPPAQNAEPYDDDDGHLFEPEIETLYVNGITTGCAPHSYCPEEAVTRAEMAAFLTRVLKLPPATGSSPYGDDDGHFLEAEISALAASGITSGCSATSFCPDELVTRGEMAAFLIRALA